MMMSVDQFSTFGRALVPKMSYMLAVFAIFIYDIGGQGTPSIVSVLRSDNGTVFNNQTFVTVLDRHRIRRVYSPVDSPKHDGMVERRIAVTLKLAMAPCLEGFRLLPPTGPLWVEAFV